MGKNIKFLLTLKKSKLIFWTMKAQRIHKDILLHKIYGPITKISELMNHLVASQFRTNTMIS